MELCVKLEVFEGPLDLLLHLLDKNKVSIYDIPIVEITNQYLDYIRRMQQQDLNIMSEFMMMAATLLDIKARWLLPKEETPDGEEEDPRAELVEQLLQYKMYKHMSLELKDRQLSAAQHLFHEKSLPKEVLSYEEPVDLDALTEGLFLPQLHEIFTSVMRRQQGKVNPEAVKFGNIEKEEISVEEKLTALQKFFKEKKSYSFRQLLQRQNSRLELVVTFLALLELMKEGSVVAKQEETFGEIMIEVNA